MMEERPDLGKTSEHMWESDPMSRALISKVREQALELSELNDKLCVANDHIILCERRISELLSTSLPNSPYGSPTRAAILARRESRNLSPKTSSRRPEQGQGQEGEELVRAEREKRERIHREEVEMLRRENASLRSTLSSKTSEVHGHGIELQRLRAEGENLRVQLEYFHRSSDPSNLKRVNKATAAVAKTQTVILQEELRKARQVVKEQEKMLRASSQREKFLMGQVAAATAATAATAAAADEENESDSEKVGERRQETGRGAAELRLQEERDVLCEEIMKLQKQCEVLAGAANANQEAASRTHALEKALEQVKKEQKERDEAAHKREEVDSEQQQLVLTELQSATRRAMEAEELLQKKDEFLSRVHGEEKRRVELESEVVRLQEHIAGMTTTLVEAEKEAGIAKEERDSAVQEQGELSKMQTALLIKAKEQAQRIRTLEEGLVRAQEGEAKAIDEAAVYKAASSANQEKKESVREHLGNMVSKYEAATREVSAMASQVELLRPRLQALEEKERQWQEEREGLQEELSLLKPLQKAFFDLEEDLQPYTRLTHTPHTSITQGGQQQSFSGDEQWCQLSSLRNVNSTLHALVSQLQRDYLQTKAVALAEEREKDQWAQQHQASQEELGKVRAELAIAQEQAARAPETIAAVKSQAEVTTQELHQRIRKAEEENLSMVTGREILKQAKYLVVSHPSGLQLLQSHLPHLISAAMTAVPVPLGGVGYSPPRTSSPARENRERRQAEEEERDALLMRHFADHMLPEVISRALSSLDQHRARRKEASREDSHSTQHTLEQLRGEHQETAMALRLCEQEKQAAAEALSTARSELQDRHAEVQDLLVLGENQRKVMTALERQNETLQKDRQLRVAQANSWQQREEAVRVTLAGAVRDYSVPPSMHMTVGSGGGGGGGGGITPAAFLPAGATPSTHLHPYHPHSYRYQSPAQVQHGFGGAVPGAIPASFLPQRTQTLAAPPPFEALHSMRMPDLLQQVTSTMEHLHRLTLLAPAGGSPPAAGPALAATGEPVQEGVDQGSTGAGAAKKVVQAVAEVTHGVGSGAEAPQAGGSVAPAREGGKRSPEVGEEVPPTWGSDTAARASVPRRGVQADIEAAVEGKAPAPQPQPQPQPQPPLKVPSNAPRERAPSLLPAEEALGALGSPVTQLQARLSKARQNFRSLREKRL